MPFAGYKNFDGRVSKNSDKDDPAVYCGSIKANTEKSLTLTKTILSLSELVTKLEDT